MLSGVSKKTLLKVSLVVVVLFLIFLLVVSFLIIMRINVIKKQNEFSFHHKFVPMPADNSQHIVGVKDWTFNSSISFNVEVSFYNAKDSLCESEGALVNFNCPDSSFDGNSSIVDNPFSIEQKSVKVGIKDHMTLLFEVTPSEYLVKDSYACSFNVVCGGSVVESYPVFITIV